MRRFVLALLALVLAAAFAPGVDAQRTNRIRIMHASPNAPNIDVFVNSSRVLANVPFFEVTQYLPLNDGRYKIDVSATGQSVEQAVWTGELEVRGGVTGTIAAVNTLENLELVLYDDTITPIQGKARVRVIHGSPDAPPIDLKVAGTRNALITAAPFKGAATLELNPGMYKFDVTPAGSNSVVYTTGDLLFLPGWTYTLVATGQINRGGFWVQSRVDNYIRPDGMAALYFRGGAARITRITR